MMHFATDDEWNDLAETAPVVAMEIWLTLYGEEHDEELIAMLERNHEMMDDEQMEFDWEGTDTND